MNRNARENFVHLILVKEECYVQVSRKKVRSFASGTLIKLCRYAFFVSFSFVVLYPYIYILINSLKGSADYADPVVQWVPKHLYFGNFASAAKVFELGRTIGNSLVYEIIPALLQFCSCAVAGYGLARFDFKGKKILTGIMMLTILVPTMMIITPSYVNYSHMDFLGILNLISRIVGHDIRPNLINTPFAFYIPALLGVGLKGGFFIYIFSQFYRKLPKELEEAAWMDGAGAWRTFLRIAVPTSGPAAITVLLFSVVWHWNDYYLAQMYNSEHPTFSVALNNFSVGGVSAALETGMTIGKAMAVPILLTGCLLFILPLVILYILMQKKFIASITTSGIVG